jgi:hypothetical protein
MVFARSRIRVVAGAFLALILATVVLGGAGCSSGSSSSAKTPASASLGFVDGSSLLPWLPTDQELLASSTRLGRVVDLIQAWLNTTKIDRLPVYLPSAMPTGWAIAQQASHGQGTDNPAIWKTGRASPGALAAGYALSFTDGVSRIQLVANPAGALTDLSWEASATVSKARNEPLKVAQTGSTFYALFSSPEKMSVYVWGVVSNKDRILGFASILTQRALLGSSSR